jgi:hypothetical protein
MEFVEIRRQLDRPLVMTDPDHPAVLYSLSLMLSFIGVVVRGPPLDLAESVRDLGIGG